MTPQQAERWLALEMLAVLTLRTVYAVRKQGFPSIRIVLPTFAAFGILSLTAQARTLSKASAYFGGLITILLLVQPVAKDKSTVGGEVFDSLTKATDAGVDPGQAKGYGS